MILKRINQMEKNIKHINMDSLAQYRNFLYSSPRLTYLFLELTNACNLSCLHCGSNASPKNTTYLPLNDAKKVIRLVAQHYQSQNIMICLSGGEPLLHPHFFEIASYAHECGFTCGITTNGTLIDESTAQKIVSGHICSVTFSLDGLRENHDWFRNKKGSFLKTIQGIQNLIKESEGTIATQITTVIHKKNLSELDALYQLVTKLNIDSWRIINLEPIGRALENNNLLLNAEEMQTLLNFIREKRYQKQTTIDITYGCSHYLTIDYEREVRDGYFICGSGIYVASILCNGDIYSCLDIQRRPELVQGNIYQDNFIDIWENKFQIFRKDRTKDCELCSTCADKNYCMGDSAHTWDYDTMRPLLCLKQLFNNKEANYDKSKSE